MAIDLTSDYFELFSMPREFEINLSALGEKYRELQKETHPDKFAASESQAQRVSAQGAAHVNEVYETLKDPLRRGFYLLELEGVGTGTHEYTTSDSLFLMRQLEHREALEDIRGQDDPFEALDVLRDTVSAEEREQMEAFKSAYAARDFDTAYDALTKVMFIRRLLEQIDDTEAHLEDELD